MAEIENVAGPSGSAPENILHPPLDFVQRGK
jgi:hypothetical protein